MYQYHSYCHRLLEYTEISGTICLLVAPKFLEIFMRVNKTVMQVRKMTQQPSNTVEDTASSMSSGTDSNEPSLTVPVVVRCQTLPQALID